MVTTSPGAQLYDQLERAQAYLEVGDVEGTRRLLEQCRRQLAVSRAGYSSDPGVAATWVGAPAGPGGHLTTAELRVLGLLPTHLSATDIGRRLHRSHNTIKSQVASVYRKLGASNRGDAIARARRLGLLPGVIELDQ